MRWATVNVGNGSEKRERTDRARQTGLTGKIDETVE